MSRGRLFGTLCSLVMLVSLARLVFAPLLAEFIVEFGVREGTAGLIASLVWLGSALPRVPTGWLLTRVPRHRVVLGTGSVLALAAGFTAAADSVALVMAGALLMGLSSGVYFVAAAPLVSELYPERVGRAVGVHGGASQVAAVGAAPFVTLAVVAGSWRLVFVGIGLGALVASLALFVTARGTDLPDAGRRDRDFLGAIRAEWRLVLVGVVIVGATGFLWQGLFNFYELYMRTKGLTDAAAKNSLTLVFAAGLPAFVVSGRLADRLPVLPYLLSVLAAFVALVFALTVTRGVAPVLLLTVLVGYVVHSLFPAMDTYLLGGLPDESRASAYAAYSGSMMLIQAPGASVVGSLVEAGLPYDAVFAGLATGLGLLVVAMVGLDRLGRLPR